MADNSAIEWTDATWNPIRARNKKTGKVGWFCTHKSEGCRNCYAETWNMRLGTGLPYKPGHLADVEIFLDRKMLEVPLRWKRPRNIFTLSMSDLFGEFIEPAWVREIFDVMVRTPQHTYQVLTKREDRMHDQMHELWDVPPPNVWLGVSIEDQTSADERIPVLLRTPAVVRFLSCEPLLGPIDLASPYTESEFNRLVRTEAPWARGSDTALPGITWVIVGGESGDAARPMHPAWVRDLRDQCAAAGVHFFFKQWGEWEPREQWSGHLGGGRFEPMVAIMPDGAEVPHDVVPQDVGGCRFARVGKRKAGRLLDGIEHNEVPIVVTGRIEA